MPAAVSRDRGRLRRHLGVDALDEVQQSGEIVESVGAFIAVDADSQGVDPRISIGPEPLGHLIVAAHEVGVQAELDRHGSTGRLSVARLRSGRERDQKLAQQQAAKLEQVFQRMEEGEVQSVKLMLKADEGPDELRWTLGDVVEGDSDFELPDDALAFEAAEVLQNPGLVPAKVAELLTGKSVDHREFPSLLQGLGPYFQAMPAAEQGAARAALLTAVGVDRTDMIRGLLSDMPPESPYASTALLATSSTARRSACGRTFATTW